MSTTTKKYQIIQKLKNGNTLVLHPETEASVVSATVSGYSAKNVEAILRTMANDITGIDDNMVNYVHKNQKGAANGVASLDINGRVPSSQLPSYVDDVIEGYYYNTKFYKEAGHTTEITGESGKIYVDLATNKTYRWSGSTFGVISETLALGTTSSTAYAGNKGKELEETVTSMQTDIGANSSQIVGIKYGTIAAGKAKALDHDVDFCIDSDTLVGSNDQLSNLSGTEVHLNVELKNSGITAGTYSCVTVDQYGRATAGAQIVEVGTTGQTTPSSTLAIGGIFFKEI